MSDVQIRWMVRRDIEDVAQIERGCFEFPWTETDFIETLRIRNCIGMVAERNENIVGFMLYEILKHEMHVLNFAVSPHCQRDGIGSQMMEKLRHKLSQQRRHTLTLDVRESNLPAQTFFRSQGFEWVKTLIGYYEDTSEDAYRMTYRLLDQPRAVWCVRNRISEFLQGVE